MQCHIDALAAVPAWPHQQGQRPCCTREIVAIACDGMLLLKPGAVLLQCSVLPVGQALSK